MTRKVATFSGRVVRDELRRLAQRDNTQAVTDRFDASQNALHEAVLRVAGRSTQPVDVRKARELQSQYARAQRNVALAVSRDINTLLGETRNDSLGLARRLVSRFTSTLDDERVARRVSEANDQLGQRGLSQLLAKWHTETQAKIKAAGAQALRDELSPAEFVSRLREVADGERWKLERIIRTETSFAFNAVQEEAVVAIAEVHRDVMKRWTELVDDTTGQPFDKRVGRDSIAMHGQVTRPGGVFTMPNDRRVDSKWWGRQWSFPPNRPNDRSVVIPWRPEFGVPAWICRSGTRTPYRG